MVIEGVVDEISLGRIVGGRVPGHLHLDAKVPHAEGRSLRYNAEVTSCRSRSVRFLEFPTHPPPRPPRLKVNIADVNLLDTRIESNSTTQGVKVD